MPKIVRERPVKFEEVVADRVHVERLRRGWSYETMAKLMTEAGCPIHHSGLYRIEAGSPRRRITVDEMVGFAHVLDMSFEQLLTPAEDDHLAAATAAVTFWAVKHQETLAALEAERIASDAIEEALNRFGNTDLARKLRDRIPAGLTAILVNQWKIDGIDPWKDAEPETPTERPEPPTRDSTRTAPTSARRSPRRTNTR